jgi:CRP-like cAMP-binding protein
VSRPSAADELGTVVEADGEIKVKWDSGSTSYFRRHDLPMRRRHIADYLGLTIETISRVLTKLESEFAISMPTARRIIVRDRSVLKLVH